MIVELTVAESSLLMDILDAVAGCEMPPNFWEELAGEAGDIYDRLAEKVRDSRCKRDRKRYKAAMKECRIGL